MKPAIDAAPAAHTLPALTPPAGGPAAINGFLYQLLLHLSGIAQAQCLQAIDGQALQGDWTLVLEPRSGADAEVDLHGELVVEQYKVRSGGGTWSIRELIEEVLRGLRRAVPQVLPPRATYRFVTDGRPGLGVQDLIAFFARVRTASDPAALDDTERRDYAGATYTDREFLAHIAEATRSKASPTDPHEHERLCHLVGHFAVTWELKAQDVEAKVDHLLQHYFPRLHDARATRRKLVALLLEKLSRGELILDAQGVRDLFLEADLDPQVVEKVARLAEGAAQVVAERLARSGYVAAHDVREALAWPDDRPVLLVTGESGNGKSWQLAKLMASLAEAREVVTWSQALSNAAAQRDRITEDIWALGLERPAAPSLTYLNLFVKSVLERPGHWLTTAVDQVEDLVLAKELVSCDWSRTGMRLALAVPSHIAAHLQALFPTMVHVHEVRTFSVKELDRYLRHHGRRWSELPDDLKQLLKQPILAGVYAQLPVTSFAAAPRSEYEIFAAFWQRMQARANLGDAGVLVALARRVLEHQAYPVQRTEWSEVGAADGAALARLQALGWVRVSEAGELAFAHDRLLNWATAVVLAGRVDRGEMPIDDLAKLLLDCTDAFTRRFARSLGYVLMDFVWLLARRAPGSFDFDKLLDRLEEAPNGLGRELYDGMLPTLGQPAVPLLVARLKEVAALNDYRTITLGDGLAKLARQEAVLMASAIEELLAAATPQEQRVGLRLLALQPDARQLDRLWSMEQWHAPDRDFVYKIGTEWWDAMRACLALDPGWLLRRTQVHLDPGERFADLAYLLAGFDHPEAERLWTQVRAAFVARVPAEYARGVVNCIARFCDADLVEYCIDHVRVPQDSVDGASLRALARVDPDAALEHLHWLPAAERYYVRGWWLPLLLEVRPRETRARVLALAQTEDSPLNALGMLFESHPDDLGPELLDFYLRTFEQELVARSPVPGETANDDWLSRPLDVLGGICSAEGLARLRAEQGRPIEHLVTEAAKRRIGTTGGCRDRLLEGARGLLLRIAGTGIVQLVTAELLSPVYWGRHSGLLFAEVAGAPAKAPLHAIAKRAPEEGLAADSARMERYLALTKLAALGADAELIDTIWTIGTDHVSDKLAYLRSHHGPVDRALLDDAVEVLKAPASDPRMDRALIIAWLSGDKDFIPLLRPLLAALDGSSLTGRLACLALWRLDDQSEELLDLAQRMLATSSRWIAINVLASFRSRGRAPLEEALKKLPPGSCTPEDDALVEALFEQGPSRTAAIEAATRRLARGRAGWFFSPPFEIAASGAPSASVQDQVLTAAFTTDRTVVGRSVEATRAIAKFDPHWALEAADLELKTTAKTADETCRVVLGLSGADPVAWLTTQARQLPEDRLGAIGRTLRKLDPARVEAALEAMLQSPIRAERLVALQLCGWTHAPGDARLRNLLELDPEGPVRDAAREALQRRRGLENSARLLNAVASAVEANRWSLLQVLITSTHTALLTDRESDLWLAHALDPLPPRFVHFAQEALKRKKDEM